MAVVGTTTDYGYKSFPHAQVAGLLPAHIKERALEMQPRALIAANHILERMDEVFSHSQTFGQLVIVTGLFFAVLGGVFLASSKHYKLSPSRVTIASHLGMSLVGGMLSFTGWVISLMGGRTREKIQEIQGELSHQFERGVIAKYFSQKLKEGELFAIHDPKRRDVCILEYKKVTPLQYDEDEDEVLTQWAGPEHGDHFIEMNVLRERVQQETSSNQGDQK